MDSLFPIRGSGDPELVLVSGIIMLSGSTTGSNQNVGITHSLVGLLPQGGAVPAASSGVGVSRLATGSYQINLDQNYPALKSAQFEPFVYAPLYDISVVGNLNASNVPASGTIGFFITSGSAGSRTLYDPTGSIHVHCALTLKKSSA